MLARKLGWAASSPNVTPVWPGSTPRYSTWRDDMIDPRRQVWQASAHVASGIAWYRPQCATQDATQGAAQCAARARSQGRHRGRIDARRASRPRHWHVPTRLRQARRGQAAGWQCGTAARRARVGRVAKAAGPDRNGRHGQHLRDAGVSRAARACCERCGRCARCAFHKVAREPPLQPANLRVPRR